MNSLYLNEMIKYLFVLLRNYNWSTIVLCTLNALDWSHMDKKTNDSLHLVHMTHHPSIHNWGNLKNRKLKLVFSHCDSGYYLTCTNIKSSGFFVHDYYNLHNLSFRNYHTFIMTNKHEIYE